MLQKWSTENKQAEAAQEAAKTNQIITIFSLAVTDAANNLAKQLSDPDNNNSNFICAAESASGSENTLSEC